MKHKLAYEPQLKLADLLPQLPQAVQDALLDRFGNEVGDQLVKRVPTSSRPKVQDGKRQILIDVSTRDMDRDREILIPTGADFSEFELSGVVVDSHNYSSIERVVGHAVNLSKNDKTVPMVIEFLPTDLGEVAWTIAQHMPMTASVGFIPLDIIDKSHDDWADTVKQMAKDWPEFKKNRDKVERIIRKWLLLEVSIVSVPANAHALSQDVAKALKDGAITAEEAQLAIKGYAKLEEPESNEPPAPADPPPESDTKGAEPPADPPAEPAPPELIVEKAHEPFIERIPQVERIADPEAIAKAVENAIAIRGGKV